MAQSERRGGAGACERERAAAPPRSHAHTTNRPTDPPPPPFHRHRSHMIAFPSDAEGAVEAEAGSADVTHSRSIPDAFQKHFKSERGARAGHDPADPPSPMTR